MKCQRSEELWSDYLERTLPGPLLKDLEEHLGSCADCPPLLEAFREVVDSLRALPRPQPAPELVDRLLSATARLAAKPSLGARLNWPLLRAQPWGNWAAGGATAAILLLLIGRPPKPLAHLGRETSQMGHQAYSFAVRIYRDTDRLLDELNVLRMTVGVAFEDRLDRLNERLRDLEESRRKTEQQQDKRSGLGSGRLLSHQKPKETFQGKGV